MQRVLKHFSQRYFLDFDNVDLTNFNVNQVQVNEWCHCVLNAQITASDGHVTQQSKWQFDAVFCALSKQWRTMH